MDAIKIKNLESSRGKDGLGGTYACSRAEKDWDASDIWVANSNGASSVFRRLRGGGCIDSFEIRRF